MALVTPRPCLGLRVCADAETVIIDRRKQRDAELLYGGTPESPPPISAAVIDAIEGILAPTVPAVTGDSLASPTTASRSTDPAAIDASMAAADSAARARNQSRAATTRKPRPVQKVVFEPEKAVRCPPLAPMTDRTRIHARAHTRGSTNSRTNSHKHTNTQTHNYTNTQISNTK